MLKQGTLILVLLAIPLPLQSQSDTGLVSGTVKDPSGATVGSAHVSIRNSDTGQVVSIPTNEQGIYVSPPLRPGNYSIEIEAAGFRKGSRSLPLDVNQRAVIDF